jgi:hypothetical protein
MKKHLPLKSTNNVGSTKSNQRQMKARQPRSELFNKTKNLVPLVIAPILLSVSRWIE